MGGHQYSLACGFCSQSGKAALFLWRRIMPGMQMCTYGGFVTCDAAIAFAMRISQSRKSAGWLAGWRLAFSRFWLALYITEWSGVGGIPFSTRAGRLAIYLSPFLALANRCNRYISYTAGAVSCVGCVRFCRRRFFYIYWFCISSKYTGTGLCCAEKSLTNVY